MRYYIHDNEKELNKKDRIIIIVIFSIIFIPLIIFYTYMSFMERDIIIFLILGGSIAITALSFVVLYYINYRIDYIDVNNMNIKVHIISNRKIKKSYDYSEIKVLYIDDCPGEFIPFADYFSETGASFRESIDQNKYIIARDEEKNFLFVCCYREKLWYMLLNKCKDYLVFQMNEEEYKNFKEERKKLIDLVEKETIRKGMEEYNKIQNY